MYHSVKTEESKLKQHTCSTTVLITFRFRPLVLSFTAGDKKLVKPPSHQPRSHYVLQKLGGRSKNFVQRSRNAVETDKDVIWSPWTWRTWSNFGHVQKKRSEDVVESGRSTNLIRT